MGARHGRGASRSRRPLPDPELFRQFPFNVATRLLAPGDLRGSPEQVAFVRSFARAGDPAADALVAALRDLPNGAGYRLFDRALADGIHSVPDAPPELASFFQHVETVPYWLDREKLVRGARAVARAGIYGFAPLGDLSLMGGYLASRATKTLVATGELEHMALKRLTETASWWLEVTTPGALARDRRGWASTLRVRLTHAQIRAAMLRRGDWDWEAWDAPVNQVQTAGTLQLFSLVFLVGLRALGLRYTDRERDAMIHLWRYVGWLLGVDERLLPATEDDAWRLLWLLASTEFIPDEDSRRLGQALLAVWGKLLPEGIIPDLVGRGILRMNGSFSRMVLGKRNADLLGLPNDPVSQLMIAGVAVGTFGVETVRRRVPGATRVAEVFGQATRREVVERVAARAGADRSYLRRGSAAGAPPTAARARAARPA